jgi:DNA polymerase-3 subunit alpha
VRNVGTNVVDAIVAARSAKGAFSSFSDFLRKVPVNVCNKRVIESLVKAGAFDSLGHPRKGLCAHPRAGHRHRDRRQAQRGHGQDSLFGGDAEIEASFEIPVPEGEWDKPTLLGFEAGDARLYVSDHPLLGIGPHPVRRHRLLGRAALGVAVEDAERAAHGERSDAQPVSIGGHLVRSAAQGDQAGHAVGGRDA